MIFNTQGSYFNLCRKGINHSILMINIYIYVWWHSLDWKAHKTDISINNSTCIMKVYIYSEIVVAMNINNYKYFPADALKRIRDKIKHIIKSI